MQTENRWTEEADVVVVGYGGAGAAAAMTAHDAGARVLLLEKQTADTPELTRHIPNTRVSAGAWLSPTDVEAAVLHFEAMARVAHETLDEERRAVIRTLAVHLAENDRWLRGLGAQWADGDRALHTDYPELPGAEAMAVHAPKPDGKWRNGPAIFKVLAENVARRNIPVLWETAGRELVVEGGEVRGVIAERGGQRLAIRASRAVVLTCGGFEFNEWMKQNYLRAYPVYFRGCLANTGDGISMALGVGAALWHMNCTSWRAVMKTPDLVFARRHIAAGEVFVDKRGRRFANEVYRGHAFGYDLVGYESGTLNYPRIPCYWVFDEKRMRAGSLAETAGPCNPPGGVPGPAFYVWSQDNQEELRKGWVMQADTLAELAKKIAQDQDNQGMMTARALQETVRGYNRCCLKGEDAEFRRPTETLIPLKDPPYYAVKLWPGSTNTQGGPKRNPRCQVLRPDGAPIPRLYSAGELGSFWGMLTENGAGTGEAYASGRIAGGNADSEKPRR